MSDYTFIEGISDGLSPDRWGRIWPEGTEICRTCGQPDNCADCNHLPLTTEDVERLLND